jgi:hypothetical protein
VTAPDAIRVFVNERPAEVPRGATALDAVRALDAALAEGVAGGHRAITDSRGLPVEPATAAYAGAIYRVVAARRAPDAEGEA